MGTTLAEKVWADHLVRKGSDGGPLICCTSI